MTKLFPNHASRVLAAFSALCLFGATACSATPAAPKKAPAKRTALAVKRAATAKPKAPAAALRTAKAQEAPRVLARVAQNSAQLAKLELRMMQMVNAARAQRGLTPLGLDEDLADTARAHSLEMRDRDYFAHESPTENLRHPLDRYRASIGDTPNIVAENIYRSWGSPRDIEEGEVRTAHNALMKSPGHRANIMMPKLTRIGIGFIANANGDLWITQMFSRP